MASWWQPATIRWLRWLLLSVGTFYFPLLLLVLSWNIDASTSGKLLQFPSLNELIAHSIHLLLGFVECNYGVSANFIWTEIKVNLHLKSTILCGKTYFAPKISQQVLWTTICSSFASRLNFCVVMRVFFHCLWMNIQLMNPVSAVLNAFICSHKFVCSHVCLYVCVFLYNFCVLSEIEKVYVRACLLLMRKKKKKK